VTFQSSIGKTVEGRDMAMVYVTSPNGNLATKKRVWLQGQQHAREWIAGATTAYIAYALASGYGNDTRITNLLDQVEYRIMPVVNSDGTEYTWDSDRLWRKSRQVINGDPAGVDLNRNWPDHWNQGGSSTDPSSDVYMGPSAGSEPEVQALMAAYTATPNMIAAVDFHSYSELILRPYGWTDQNSPDDATFTTLGAQIQSAIQSSGEDQYVNERIVDLYVASGGASDWFYGLGSNQSVYGISIELSPSADQGGADGSQGFILPPERILPVSKSMISAMLTMTEYSMANPLPGTSGGGGGGSGSGGGDGSLSTA